MNADKEIKTILESVLLLIQMKAQSVFLYWDRTLKRLFCIANVMKTYFRHNKLKPKNERSAALIAKEDQFRYQ